jgi:branched-chain amino acid transport system ATP-binding protein
MPLLAIDNVTAGYEQLDILQNVSLGVERGEIVTVIGPNGAGKSTLMKAIFGLVTVRAGSIVFDGQPITGLKPNVLVRRGMGFVPQSLNVFATLTVEENLKMGGAIAAGGVAGRIEAMLTTFPSLRKRARAVAAALSGGERQMLAMARAMMLEPRLMLLDEPSAGLSPKVIDEVLEKIRELAGRGISFVLVEQNAKQALAHSDRGYVLVAGRNAIDGRGSDLLADPEIGRLYLGG